MTDGSGSPGLYVHVPFCLRKCRYCAFYSVADLDSDAAMRFGGSLLGEMRMRLPSDTVFPTFYAGGGTPVLLEPSFWSEVFAAVPPTSRLAEDAEVTIEANPAAVGLKDLQDLRRSGFNRLSIGVQSFDDALLEFLGRVHNGAQAEEMVRDARKAGFESIGIDLMYGIPGQTREDWLKDLRSAVDLGAEHISCYSLTVEDGTPYGHSVKSGDAPVPDESLVAELYRATDELLSRAGYQHYEVSNYAAGRKWRSRHNTAYWSGAAYLGFGPSAHSYDGRSRRSWNRLGLNEYLEAVESGGLPEADFENLSEGQLMLERIMLGLRTSDGVDLSKAGFEGEADGALRNMFANWVSHGLCTVDGLRISPTSQGMLMADGMASSLAAILDL
ncbi:MAG: radical SAM family heme chaperone HemW [Candidatus Fermentibacter sp.]|nr:radical SAM family heme chaperone HemW [Candidatus Fermentibacter sp.]